jgi:hypothetical protein
LGDRTAELLILAKDVPLIPKNIQLESNTDKKVQIDAGTLSME